MSTKNIHKLPTDIIINNNTYKIIKNLEMECLELFI